MMMHELLHNIECEIVVSNNVFEKTVLSVLRSIVADAKKLNSVKSPLLENALLVNMSNNFADLYTLLKLTDHVELQQRAHEYWYVVDSQIAMNAVH